MSNGKLINVKASPVTLTLVAASRMYSQTLISEAAQTGVCSMFAEWEGDPNTFIVWVETRRLLPSNLAST